MKGDGNNLSVSSACANFAQADETGIIDPKTVYYENILFLENRIFAIIFKENTLVKMKIKIQPFVEYTNMEEKRQILFMQIRILKMASEKFKLSLADTARLFKEYDVLRYIREFYGIFHTEGDIAVFEDVKEYLKCKGAEICTPLAKQ